MHKCVLIDSHEPVSDSEPSDTDENEKSTDQKDQPKISKQKKSKKEVGGKRSLTVFYCPLVLGGLNATQLADAIYFIKQNFVSLFPVG